MGVSRASSVRCIAFSQAPRFHLVSAESQVRAPKTMWNPKSNGTGFLQGPNDPGTDPAGKSRNTRTAQEPRRERQHQSQTRPPSQLPPHQPNATPHARPIRTPRRTAPKLNKRTQTAPWNKAPKANPATGVPVACPFRLARTSTERHLAARPPFPARSHRAGDPRRSSSCSARRGLELGARGLMT